MSLLRANETHPTSPKVPKFLPFILYPKASAASSTTFIDVFLQILIILSILFPLPDT